MCRAKVTVPIPFGYQTTRVYNTCQPPSHRNQRTTQIVLVSIVGFVDFFRILCLLRLTVFNVICQACSRLDETVSSVSVSVFTFSLCKDIPLFQWSLRSHCFRRTHTSCTTTENKSNNNKSNKTKTERSGKIALIKWYILIFYKSHFINWRQVSRQICFLSVC